MLIKDAELSNDIWFFLEGEGRKNCETSQTKESTCGGRCSSCYVNSLLDRWTKEIEKSKTHG